MQALTCVPCRVMKRPQLSLYALSCCLGHVERGHTARCMHGVVTADHVAHPFGAVVNCAATSEAVRCRVSSPVP